MSESTVRLRVMLQSYEQQLMAARRLAKFRAKCRLLRGEERDDPDPQIKRRSYVEKVAREVYESLIYTGSPNPINEEIRAELSAQVGIELQFTYPPGKRLRIVKVTPEGQMALSEEEQQKVRLLFFRVTREKINASMLDEYGDQSSQEWF